MTDLQNPRELRGLAIISKGGDSTCRVFGHNRAWLVWSAMLFLLVYPFLVPEFWVGVAVSLICLVALAVAHAYTNRLPCRRCGLPAGSGP